ncbi:choice-of-anchor D domain-containing protein, partial [bacterium]|nr:choice-of-anchor D domain-containing protein [bacterium]
NFIGTDVTGTLDKGNSQDGIRINLGMANQIGGNTAGSGNVVSGNNLRGVELLNARYNWIAGNYIGVNTSGTSAIANSDAGITSNGSKFNTIGDSTAGGRNVISGNNAAGIMLQNSSDSNQVIGNYIGLDKNGTTTIANGLSGFVGGIQVISNSIHNYIGTQSANSRNVISGNAGPGIRSDAKFTKILNNIIGLDASGTSAKPNTTGGITTTGSGDFLTIGQPNAGNIISGNQQEGIRLSSADSCTVQGNLIGTDITGTIDLGNSGHGIMILGGTFDLIGGTSAGQRNIISGNSDGVLVQGGTYHKIFGNYIGLAVNGTTSLGNSQAGVNLNIGASFITVGDTLTGGRNVISGNTRGVNIQDPTTKFNTVIGNYIGTNASGTDSVRNTFAGIDISNGSKYNQIGNGNLNGKNLISGNANTNGIRIIRADSNEVKYNVIGATENGTTTLWNKQGIEVDSSRGIVITRNIISGNTQHGVRLLNSAVASITHNVIGGAGVTGNGPLPNGQSGLFISTRSRVDYAIQNIIAYNSTYGILADGPATDSSIFYLNNIFKNGQGGISLQNGAQKNIAPPRITNVDYDGTVSGNAAPNASVHIYADSLTQNQGRYPLGTTNADASGNWSKQVGLMAGTILTALQDSAQNTSAFSSPFTFTSFTGSLSVLPSATIDFGTVIVGDTRNQTIQLTSENDNVRLHSIGSGLAAPFQMLTTITTPDTLILGVDTISASFSFTPSATGDFTDTVEFLTSGGIVNLILQGHAVPVGQITPLPSASIDFGNVAMGSSASQTIGLVATGNQTVIYPFTDVLALPFKLNATTTNLLDTLTPGVDTIRMQFSFEPTTTGNFKDTLLLPTSGGELPIILQGQGIQLDAAAPVLAIKLLRSTVAQQYVDIIVKANEDLSELNGSLTLGNTINVTPSKIGNSSQLFSTTYRLTEGTLNISMTGKDLAGNPATQTRNYTVAAFGKNYFSLKHSTMELTASNSSSPKSGFVMLTTVPHAVTKGLSKSDVSSSWTQIGSKVQLFTTADFSEGQFLNLRSYYDQNEITNLKTSHADFDERKIGLYQYSEENSSWMYLGGEGYQMQVNAKIAKAGEIAAFYNPDHVVLPKSLELSQNYPNPFNPTTTIRFGLPEESRVILSVYNILGQKIRELINDARTAGYYQINWDGKNESGLQAASGVYIYRLETVSGVKMKKMLLIK